jgi:Flp pilus assembly CpaE family ATPase
LCGPPKREMRGSIAPAFLEHLFVELARRYRYVVVDVGPELLGMDTTAANHRAVLASASKVLVVSASDLVGLWHARTALDQLERQLGIGRRTVNLILNRNDSRFHHARSEVEWHLGAPIAAVVPFDQPASQRAIAEQRPIVVDPTSRAGRVLISLAERIHNDKLRLPAEPVDRRGSEGWWRRVLVRPRSNIAVRQVPAPESLGLAQPRDRSERAW